MHHPQSLKNDLKSQPLCTQKGLVGGARGEELDCTAGDTRDAGSILGQEDPLEEGMATHSSILFFLIFIFTLFYFTILYWFCHTLT